MTPGLEAPPPPPPPHPRGFAPVPSGPFLLYIHTLFYGGTQDYEGRLKAISVGCSHYCSISLSRQYTVLIKIVCVHLHHLVVTLPSFSQPIPLALPLILMVSAVVYTSCYTAMLQVYNLVFML